MVAYKIKRAQTFGSRYTYLIFLQIVLLSIFRYCHGVCQSFFIPQMHPKRLKAAFVSCSACSPSEYDTVNVTLDCPGQNPPQVTKSIMKVRYFNKDIMIIYCSWLKTYTIYEYGLLSQKVLGNAGQVWEGFLILLCLELFGKKLPIIPIAKFSASIPLPTLKILIPLIDGLDKLIGLLTSTIGDISWSVFSVACLSWAGEGLLCQASWHFLALTNEIWWYYANFYCSVSCALYSMNRESAKEVTSKLFLVSRFSLWPYRSKLLRENILL